MQVTYNAKSVEQVTCSVFGFEAFPVHTGVRLEHQSHHIGAGDERMGYFASTKAAQHGMARRIAVVNLNMIVSALLMRFDLKFLKNLNENKNSNQHRITSLFEW